MNKIEEELLNKIVTNNIYEADAYNIRKNGCGVERKTNPFIDITTKEDKSGIDIIVKDNTLFGVIDIPVIVTESGLCDVVYNDFYIGKNSNVIIVAGCGIHSENEVETSHNGIHRFYLEEGSKVKYIEKHYGEGSKKSIKVLNPITEIKLKKNSTMEMETVQIEGVDSSIRVTKAKVGKGATLIVNEKILTTGKEKATTSFDVLLEGDSASCQVTSRSVATDKSYQEFKSNVIGDAKCYGHVECDAIIKDKGRVKAIPEIFAKDPDSNLVHEATIGKIAGDELTKLMSLGLSEKEAEEVIIKGFLK